MLIHCCRTECYRRSSEQTTKWTYTSSRWIFWYEQLARTFGRASRFSYNQSYNRLELDNHLKICQNLQLTWEEILLTFLWRDLFTKSGDLIEYAKIWVIRVASSQSANDLTVSEKSFWVINCQHRFGKVTQLFGWSRYFNWVIPTDLRV